MYDAWHMGMRFMHLTMRLTDVDLTTCPTRFVLSASSTLSKSGTKTTPPPPPQGAIRGRLVLIAAILVSVGWVCILGSWAVVTVVMVLASSVQIDSTLLFLFLLINFSVLRWGSFMGITARRVSGGKLGRDA